MRLTSIHKPVGTRRTMREGMLDNDKHWQKNRGWGQHDLNSSKYVDQQKLFKLGQQAASATRMDPDFLSDALTVLTRVAVDIDHTMFKGVDTPKDLIAAIKRINEKGYWPPTTKHRELRVMWLRQRYANLFRLANTISEKTKDDTVEAQLVQLIEKNTADAETWREELRTPIELYKLLQGAGKAPGKPAEKSTEKLPEKQGARATKRPTPRIGIDDPY